MDKKQFRLAEQVWYNFYKDIFAVAAAVIISASFTCICQILQLPVSNLPTTLISAAFVRLFMLANRNFRKNLFKSLPAAATLSRDAPAGSHKSSKRGNKGIAAILNSTCKVVLPCANAKKVRKEKLHKFK